MIQGARKYSPAEITASVMANVGDAGVMSDGYYNGLIVRAMKELALDTFFDHRTFTKAVPSSLMVTMPEDFAGLKKVFAYSGTQCEPSAMKNAHYHDRMTRQGGGAYFAENRGWNGTDPVADNLWYNEPNVLFFGLQDGVLMLSSGFTAYENVYVEYNGTGTKFGDEPLIPAWAQQAIIDWCTVEALRPKVAENPGRWIPVKRDAELSLLGDGRKRGSWAEAKKRVQQIDQKGVADLHRTLTSFGEGH